MMDITFKDGDIAHYEPNQYTDCKYDGKYFIVVYNEQWIGLYNLDDIKRIDVKREQTYNYSFPSGKE